jgi:hypothetical protein
MSKFLTEQQIRDAAKGVGIEYAALKAVIEVEARSSGFFSTGEPAILFERHKFWEQLGKINWFTMRLKIMALHPRICNKIAGGYGLFSEQHDKLRIAASYNREAALMSASWGVGQVMGYHWEALGYSSLQHFINCMYHSEAKQLEAMIRYIKVNNLIDELQRHDWAGFARGYNGRAYKKNNYDEKLRQAYRKYK